jgi:hypothetical protein
MAKISGRILKSEEVEFDGRYYFGPGSTEIAGAGPQQKNVAVAPAQVRILQEHSQYTVLEVTCICGQKMHLRCEYASA